MPENTYDYIVIGAGAAGCALAARLAESRKHSVLLLEAGIPCTADYNGPNYAGAGLLQLNTRRGLRHGAREAYLQGAKRSPTLTVMTDAHAESLQVRDGRVVAVRVRRDNVSITFHARRETALCAGAIGSPQLLELSGIGDSSLLAERGIGCHHHLPGVGEGLRDHVHTRLSFRCNRRGTLNDILANPVRKALFAARYALCRNGLMAGSTSTAHVLARSSPELARPDLKLQMHLLSAGDTRDPDKISFDPFPGFGIGNSAAGPQASVSNSRWTNNW